MATPNKGSEGLKHAIAITRRVISGWDGCVSLLSLLLSAALRLTGKMPPEVPRSVVDAIWILAFGYSCYKAGREYTRDHEAGRHLKAAALYQPTPDLSVAMSRQGQELTHCLVLPLNPRPPEPAYEERLATKRAELVQTAVGHGRIMPGGVGLSWRTPDTLAQMAIDRYLGRFREYLEARYQHELRQARLFVVWIEVVNVGYAPADDVQIEITAPAGLVRAEESLARELLVNSQPPSPPMALDFGSVLEIEVREAKSRPSLPTSRGRAEGESAGGHNVSVRADDETLCILCDAGRIVHGRTFRIPLPLVVDLRGVERSRVASLSALVSSAQTLRPKGIELQIAVQVPRLQRSQLGNDSG